MLIDGRSHSHEALEVSRFAALALHKQGVRVTVIAKALRVGWRTVYKWLKVGVNEGRQALRSTKAAGPEPKLREENFHELKNCLKKPARRFGYSTDLWSGPRLRDFIRRKFGIVYHRKHLPRLLRRLGLVLKFPERRALEQDSKEIRRWKKERFPEIVEFAQKKRSLVFYADEALISLIPYVGRTWTFPTCKPIARVSGKRGQHIGISAAVNQRGRICFELTRDHEKFTAKTFLRFVKKLRREQPKRHLTLIVDGSSTHTAKIVKRFAQENTAWLRLEIIPAYSPELNPAEKPWRYIKTQKLNASAIADKPELRKETTKILRALKRKPKQIASFFV